jgi:putative ABC transport system permease protein
VTWLDLRLRLRALFRRRATEQDLQDEIAFHLAMQARKQERLGASPEDARFRAVRRFGSPAMIADQCRDERRVSRLDSLLRDVRYAFHGLRRDPGFTAAAILTLSLGIGATTAIFSVVSAVLLRPLPFPGSDRLVRVDEAIAPSDRSSNGTLRRIPGMDASELAAVRSGARTLSHIGGTMLATMTLTTADGVTRLDGERTSPAILAMTQVQPLLGRLFAAEEDRPGRERVVILSHGTWQRVMAGNASVVGSRVTLDGLPHTVVGVMPPGFSFPDSSSMFWVPFVLSGPDAIEGLRFRPIARLADGASIDAAETEITSIATSVRTGKGGAPPRFELTSLKEELVSDVRTPLRILSVAAVLVLLIACVNVVSLLRARAASREREVAVRLALGAGRGRLLQQTLTESLLLALCGGATGIALAVGGVELLRFLAASMERRDLAIGIRVPRLEEIVVDWRVLAFTLAIAIASGVALGLWSAVWRSRAEVMETLRAAAGSGAAGFDLRRRHRGPGVLVVTEIALAMLLLVAAGLMLHSFVRVMLVDPGYDPTRVLTFQTSFPSGAAPARTGFADMLVARLRGLPGVNGVGLSRHLPGVQMMSIAYLTRSPRSSGQLPPPPPPGRPNPPEFPLLQVVSAGYLPAMGIQIVAGRGLEDSDGDGSRRVVLINETLARSGLLGDHPIGQQVYVLGPIPREIVGIVEDVRHLNLTRAPDPQIYVDFRQLPIPRAAIMPTREPTYVVVRTEQDPTAIAPAIRSAIREIDPQATMDYVATMDQIVTSSIARPRLYTTLIGVFAVVAVMLAAIGVYGVVSYAARHRTREIGIRMAVGATRVQVLQLMTRESLLLIGIGIAAGLAGAAAATRYMESMLFGVTPLDPGTWAAVVSIFATVATLAVLIPARRATAISPSITLRYE